MQTFEGDNTVMLQQSSRYLFKLIKRQAKGKKLEAPFEYINELEDLLATNFICLGTTPEHFMNLTNLDEALKVKTCFILKTVFTAYMESQAPEKIKANELFAHEVNDMARQHLKYVAFSTFLTKIREHKFKDPNIMPHLELIAKVFALNELTTDCQQCFAAGYFSDKIHYVNLQEAYKQALKQLRPLMIPLSETPYIPDSQLNSAIGNEWGDIYNIQLETAKQSALGNKIPDYYKEYMEPVLKAPKL